MKLIRILLWWAVFAAYVLAFEAFIYRRLGLSELSAAAGATLALRYTYRLKERYAAVKP